MHFAVIVWGVFMMLSENMLFIDFLDEWLESQKQFLEVTTWDGYQIVITNHVIPYFKDLNLKLNEVQASHIQKYFYFKLSTGLSPNTLKKHNAVLHKAFADCIFDDLLMFNPCDKTRLPKNHYFNSNVYSSVDVKELLTVIHGHYLEVPIFLTCYYGFRRSEVLGLRWSDIDFKNGIIKVRHSVTRVKSTIRKNNLKSDSSYRLLPLFDTTSEFLKNVQVYQKENGLLDNDYICKNSKGDLISPNALSKGFASVLDKYNLPHIRFHDLRHSNISLLLNGGMSLKHLSEWAGHSNINITADLYSHLDYNSKIIMGNKINDILK